MAPFRKGVGPKIDRRAIAKVNFEDRAQGPDYWKLYKEGDEFFVLKAANDKYFCHVRCSSNASGWPKTQPSWGGSLATWTPCCARSSSSLILLEA